MLVKNANTKLGLATEAQELPVIGFDRGVLTRRGCGLNAKSHAMQKGLVHKLSAIEEDEGNFVGSIECSVNVSSDCADGAEGVGDLGDFHASRGVFRCLCGGQELFCPKEGL